MNKRDIEKTILYTVCSSLVIIIYTLITYVLSTQMGFTIDFSAEYWGPISTMAGAFLGAIITGAVAISVNVYDNKKREEHQKVNAKKNLNIIKYYLKQITDNYRILEHNINEYNEIYNPYDNMILFTDDDGIEHAINFPTQESIQIYEQNIEPIKSNISNISSKILRTFEKIEQINISELTLDDLEKYLNLLGNFNSSHKEKLEYMKVHRSPQLETNEINDIIKLLEDL